MTDKEFLEDPKTIAKFTQELEAMQKRHFTVHAHLTAGLAVALIGQLQLALRHPQNKGTSTEMIRKFLDSLIERVGVYPTLKRVLLAGDDPACDYIIMPEHAADDESEETLVPDERPKFQAGERIRPPRER